MITNAQSRTTIDEIADRIYRISTPVPPEAMPGGFSFNQYLIDDEAPTIFHTGPRRLFPLVREAIDTVTPVDRLRYISFSHVESDECGALNDFLAVAPEAIPLCSRVAAFVSINDMAERPARAMADGECVSLGSREIEWIDAPHLPHNWETGYLFDRATRTFFCGDLFTQGGHDTPPLTSGDILGSSEAFRAASSVMLSDYNSFSPGSRKIFDRMVSLAPLTLACMHGSAWHDGTPDGAAALLIALADKISA
jgi:flavorubredoxin